MDLHVASANMPNSIASLDDTRRIGIVTVLFKSAPVIDAFVICMNTQTFKNFHVYFVENEVTSEACRVAIERAARFNYTFVRNDRNMGVAAANNQGMGFFLADRGYTHVLFLNNDIEFEADFLRSQASIFRRHTEVDALAPKIFYFSEPSRVWYAGGKLSYLKGGVRHFGHNKHDRLTGRPLYRVTYAPTCSLMVDAARLRASGIRMWEELFVYADDYQFCKDLRAKRIALYYAPDIKLWHKISTSTGGSQSEFSRFYLTRNWAYLGIVHYNLAVLTLIPLRACLLLFRHRDVELKALREAWRMAKERRARRVRIH